MIRKKEKIDYFAIECDTAMYIMMDIHEKIENFPVFNVIYNTYEMEEQYKLLDKKINKN